MQVLALIRRPELQDGLQASSILPDRRVRISEVDLMDQFPQVSHGQVDFRFHHLHQIRFPLTGMILLLQGANIIDIHTMNTICLDLGVHGVAQVEHGLTVLILQLLINHGLVLGLGY